MNKHIISRKSHMKKVFEIKNKKIIDLISDYFFFKYNHYPRTINTSTKDTLISNFKECNTKCSIRLCIDFNFKNSFNHFNTFIRTLFCEMLNSYFRDRNQHLLFENTKKIAEPNYYFCRNVVKGIASNELIKENGNIVCDMFGYSILVFKACDVFKCLRLNDKRFIKIFDKDFDFSIITIFDMVDLFKSIYKENVTLLTFKKKLLVKKL